MTCHRATKIFYLATSLVPMLWIWSNSAFGQAADWANLETSAQTALEQGDLDKAEANYKSALNIADKSSAIEPGVVNSLCGLSLVNHKRGNYAESERLYELAMRDMEGLVGRTSVRFANWLPDLAWLYNEHGKPDKAEVLFKSALQIRRTNLGDSDPTVATLMGQYAKFLRENGRETEAIPLELGARAIFQKQGSSPASAP
ncbi:MAG TPA: tetratricopeptide repeat protein [Oculatellaceae cyanobacterium]